MYLWIRLLTRSLSTKTVEKITL